jgi:hypothetical protein
MRFNAATRRSSSAIRARARTSLSASVADGADGGDDDGGFDDAGFGDAGFGDGLADVGADDAGVFGPELRGSDIPTPSTQIVYGRRGRSKHSLRRLGCSVLTCVALSHPWSDIDCDAFFRDLREIRRDVEASLGERDIAHVRWVERVGHAATAIGLATAWVPNPLSMAALALGRSTSWLLMHHVGHRGYDKVPGIPARLTSRGFAAGWRRFVDWPDWMMPDAWKYEHNVLSSHQHRRGEGSGSDRAEHRGPPQRPHPGGVQVRGDGIPRSDLARVLLRADHDPRMARARKGSSRRRAAARVRLYARLEVLRAICRARVRRAARALCAARSARGGERARQRGPNHTGDDLHRFDAPARSKAEAAVRQVLGSVNYRCGSELVDFAHLYLNYQIEHHLFPDVPMARYREIQPRVKALCEKHGIPYIQEGVFSRVKKMLSIAVGKTSMRRSRGVDLSSPSERSCSARPSGRPRPSAPSDDGERPSAP